MLETIIDLLIILLSITLGTAVVALVAYIIKYRRGEDDERELSIIIHSMIVGGILGTIEVILMWINS